MIKHLTNKDIRKYIIDAIDNENGGFGHYLYIKYLENVDTCVDFFDRIKLEVEKIYTEMPNGKSYSIIHQPHYYFENEQIYLAKPPEDRLLESYTPNNNQEVNLSNILDKLSNDKEFVKNNISQASEKIKVELDYISTLYKVHFPNHIVFTLHTISEGIDELENYIRYKGKESPIKDNTKGGKRIVNTTSKEYFQIIFKTPNACNYCLELMEELEITERGICILKPKFSAPLIGLIIGLKTRSDQVLIKHYSDIDLLNHFNKFLGTSYKKLNKSSYTFEQARNKTILAINSGYFR